MKRFRRSFEDFCEQYLKFPDGFKAQEPVIWSQWQLDRITRPILGLRWEDSGRRVIRHRLLSVWEGERQDHPRVRVGFVLSAGDGGTEPGD